MQQSLAHLRSMGVLCGISERWNAHAGVREDLFGFADIVGIAYDPRWGLPLGITFYQTTTLAHVEERKQKILSLDTARNILKSGKARIVIHGWSRHRLREEEVTLKDFA